MIKLYRNVIEFFYNISYFCRYILSHEHMIGLISRTAHMTKKNFEKIDKLLGKDSTENDTNQ